MGPSQGQGDETQFTEKGFEQSYTAGLPNRYAVRSKGEERKLVCTESPTISVRVERGLTVSAGTAAKARITAIRVSIAARLTRTAFVARPKLARIMSWPDAFC